MSYIRLYAQQRLLYRISVSEVADQWCLKGGVMLAAYNNGAMFRSSEDIDFNGFADGDLEDIERAIRTAVETPVPGDDGVRFDLESMRSVGEHVGAIRGGKISLNAFVGSARVPLRVDVGFGNAITPDARPMEIPTLLPELAPRPIISGYPLETIVSEKLNAVRQFGHDNTRHKDLYDLWQISREYSLDGSLVAEAIERTFSQHGAIADGGELAGLSEEFAANNATAWAAFLRKNGLKADSRFDEVLGELREFARPPLVAASGGPPAGFWHPGSGWQRPIPMPMFG